MGFREQALSFIRGKFIAERSRKIAFLFAEGVVIVLVLNLLSLGAFSAAGILPYALGFGLAWHIRSRLN